MENWELTETIISHWTKREINPGDGIRVIPLRLIRKEMREEKGKVKYLFNIVSSKNPVPVTGDFESSYYIVADFLEKEGFVPDYSRATEKYRYIHIKE